jgi:hypothetical protein
MKQAVAILLCLAVWAGLSVLPRISYACGGESGVRTSRPCCPDEKRHQHPTWGVRCCEGVVSAALIAPCTPPPSRLFGAAPPVATVVIVAVSEPPTALIIPRHRHSAIPPGSGLRLLHTTVLRI